MRYLIGLLLFSASLMGAVGTPQDSLCPDATTVPAAFIDGGAELVTGVSEKTHIQIMNASDVDLCFCYHTSTAADCDNQYWCLPPNATLSRDDIKIGEFIRARQKSGAATTGYVCVGAW